jgi:hypothetical protein
LSERLLSLTPLRVPTPVLVENKTSVLWSSVWGLASIWVDSADDLHRLVDAATVEGSVDDGLGEETDLT